MRRLLGGAALLVAGCSYQGVPDGDGITLGATPTSGPTVGTQLEAPREVSAAGIPVLVFHEICAADCTSADSYGVSPGEFDAILTVLEQHGYRSISMADFARAHAGDRAGLPRKPILLTFDDGREDAYVGADPLLEKHGMQATMFVITNAPTDKHGWYMSWPEIQDAVASGRWTMQVHAHAGHVQIAVAKDASGAPVLGSYYANDACLDDACDDHETHEAWRTRAIGDLQVADAALTAKLGDTYTSYSFAVPYSDYGQGKTNDALIPVDLRAYFDSQFEVWFTQAADPKFMTPSRDSHEVERYELTNERHPADVDAWLTKWESL